MSRTFCFSKVQSAVEIVSKKPRDSFRANWKSSFCFFVFVFVVVVACGTLLFSTDAFVLLVALRTRWIPRTMFSTVNKTKRTTRKREWCGRERPWLLLLLPCFWLFFTIISWFGNNGCSAVTLVVLFVWLEERLLNSWIRSYVRAETRCKRDNKL